MAVKCKVKLLEEKAEVPSRAHDSDSGYDIKMISIKKIEGDVIYFGTGVSLQPTSGFYFDVVPRSSISKLPLILSNSVGIIDNGYTGEILIPIRVMHEMIGQVPPETVIPMGIVTIFGKRISNLRAVGDAILQNKPNLCQLILRKRFSADFSIEDLENTSRSDGGFGSTDG
jgi:dUTPase